jgi:hypothetical protein
MAYKNTFITLALALLANLGATQGQETEFALDASFRNNLIYTQVPSAGGMLKLFANTTGGAFIRESAMQEHALPGLTDDSGNFFVKMNEVLELGALPALPRNSALVLPDGQANLEQGVHGALGQAWFGQYCWTFDFLSQELSCHSPALSPLEANTVRVDFKESASGNRISSLPRIFVEIDGEQFPVLIDTGAKLHPSPQASRALNSKNGAPVATSFIVESVFKQWEQLHPDWTVIERADTQLGNVRMIKVPAISIAGQTVGPVWFCSRPDANYIQYYSRLCGSDVEGAIGGNALQFFRMTIDYTNKLARFDR